MSREQAPMVTPVLFDCDPGVDDAVALLMALSSPSLAVLGITVVSGNVPLERTLRNALQIRDLANRPDIPIYAGCERPLFREPIYGQFHGTSGLGNVVLPEPLGTAEPGHAVDFLVQQLLAAAAVGDKITLCTTGPLTNVGLALRHSPSIAAGIDRIVMMGGAFHQAGNRTMTSEFNVLTDPHAAHIVFSSGLPITVMSLDASHQAIATPERVATIGRLPGHVAQAVAEIMTFWNRNDPKRYGGPGGPLHDPLVTAYLLRPDLFEGEAARVFVECQSELSMGQTIADWWDKSGEAANATIISKVDADGFFALLGECLLRYACHQPG